MLRRSMAEGQRMSPVSRPVILHASAVAVSGRGLLILGKSGAGKSGLAMRLIGLGATLVSDDRVIITRRGEALVASPPDTIAGLIEARDVGLMRAPYIPEAVLVLSVDLDFAPAARMPQLRIFSELEVSLELIFGRDVPNIDRALMFLLQNGRRVPA